MRFQENYSLIEKYFTGSLNQGNSYNPKQATVTPNANTTPGYFGPVLLWTNNQGLDSMPLRIVPDETKRTIDELSHNSMGNADLRRGGYRTQTVSATRPPEDTPRNPKYNESQGTLKILKFTKYEFCSFSTQA